MDVYALNIADKTKNPLARIGDIGTLLNVLIPLMMVGAGLIFLVMLLAGAFTFLTSGGNPENLKKAQGTLFAAVLGLFVVIISYLVVKLLGFFFNITLPF